jgi:hypothetical protein
MKTLFVVAMASAAMFIAHNLMGQNITEDEIPPIEQNLVREGEFALSLVEVLGLGTATSELVAEAMAAAVGIAPQNGWVANYPLTPDIIEELEDSVIAAAEANLLDMDREKALTAFRNLVAEFGLPVGSSQPPMATESPAQKNYGGYADSSTIDEYYSSEGPPVVTYYAPSVSYYTLYRWVPCPFWCRGSWFSGYYILHHFDNVDRKVMVHHRKGKAGRSDTSTHPRRIITNQITDPKTGQTVTIDPLTRFRNPVPSPGAIQAERQIVPAAAVRNANAPPVNPGPERRTPPQTVPEKPTGSAVSRTVPRTGPGTAESETQTVLQGDDGGGNSHARQGEVTTRVPRRANPDDAQRLQERRLQDRNADPNVVPRSPRSIRQTPPPDRLPADSDGNVRPAPPPGDKGEPGRGRPAGSNPAGPNPVAPNPGLMTPGPIPRGGIGQ